MTQYTFDHIHLFTPDPEGISVGRDEDGELTGAVLEVNAINYLLRAMPPAPAPLTSAAA